MVVSEEDFGQLAVKRHGISRNAIIREAIKEWLTSHETKQWPASIMNFKGLENVPSFETNRTELLPPSEDPFA